MLLEAALRKLEEGFPRGQDDPLFNSDGANAVLVLPENST
jgi:hypothetical protein